MPNAPKTPVRGIRVEDGLWRAAQAKAAAEGRTLTSVLVGYLKRYVATPARRNPDAEQGDDDAQGTDRAHRNP